MSKPPIERLLGTYMRWHSYVGDDVVMLDDGTVFMILAIMGLPFETVDYGMIASRFYQREASLRNNGQAGVTFGYLQCRGTADESYYPQGRFTTPFAKAFDDHYRQILFRDNAMWLNQTFLVIEVAPRQVGGRGGKLAAKIAKKLFQGGRTLEPSQTRVDRVRRIASMVANDLREHHARPLKIEWRNGFPFTQIGEAIAFAMTGHWRQVPLTAGSAKSVFSESFFVAQETFEVRMAHKSSYGACISMNEYPFHSSPGMLDHFLHAPYRHTLYHGWQCLDATSGQEMLTRKQNTSKRAGDRALDQASLLTTAAMEVAGNRLMMGNHAHALTIFCDDPNKLPETILRGMGDMGQGGIKVERESLSLESVLFSPIPGNFDMRGREAAVSSRNFAAFASMHNFPTGNRRGFWGGPYALLRGSGDVPVFFHPHHDGVGNMYVTGRTGSGKTTFLGFLICQAERSGAQVILWDKDGGLEALVRALDGHYLSLTNEPGVGIGLAPLKRLTDSTEDLTFLSGLIRACISTPEPYNFTPEEDRRLAMVLPLVMALPPEERELSDIRDMLGRDPMGAGARLEKWMWGREFGGIIDCRKDIVELDGHVLGFDQSAILNDPIASGATMATLFHYTGKLVDGRRLLFMLDEVWNALRLPQFHPQIHNGLKTWRKYNAPVVIGTQSAGDGLKSAIGDTIREQCPNQAHFANQGALWSDFGPEGLNRTVTEFDIIKRLPKGTGKFLWCQDADSSVVSAPMDGMSELRVISGTRQGRDAIKIARARTGDATGMRFVEAYHEALKEVAERELAI